MNVELADIVDLQQWAGRVGSRADLPILLRKLILATTGADYFRAPGGDAVGDPGWDIVLDSPTTSSPWIPAGSSRWEGGVSKNVVKKAQSDFTKRTRAATTSEQEAQTFVFFTPRTWDQDVKNEWIRRRVDQKTAHWADVRVVDGTDLITWLETQPAVHIWLAEKMGHHPTGVEPLDRWWERWSSETSPPLPPALLTAGREEAARQLVTALRGPAAVHVIATQSRAESKAFVSAAMAHEGQVAHESVPALGAPSPEVPAEPEAVAEPEAPAEPDKAAGDAAITTGAEVGALSSIGHPFIETTEAEADNDAGLKLLGGPLFNSAVLVHTAAAWARLAVHPGTLILIPTFESPDTGLATAAGHHVVLPVSLTVRRQQTQGASIEPLPRIASDEGREALKQSGVDTFRADQIARGARMNLTGLRRRFARVPVLQDPRWATGAEAATLVPLLLAGAWDQANQADLARLQALTGSDWRALVRSLQSVVNLEDSPLRVEAGKWQFTDVVDAWQLLAPQLTAVDMGELERLVDAVLGEPDPTLGMEPSERWSAGLHGIAREHSAGLRDGVAHALALLGSVVGDDVMQDGLTGQDHADIAVRKILSSDDPQHWLSLADLLPDLAEGSPTELLSAIERLVEGQATAARALFETEAEKSPFAFSRHVHLLWALEHLTFSKRYASRALLVLARLVEIDPGGSSLNRPLNSLSETLDVFFPKGVADAGFRTETLDLLRDRFPEVAWSVLKSLVPNSTSHFVMARTPPQWRDWPAKSDRPATGSQVADAISDIAGRLVEGMGSDPTRIADVVPLLQDLPGSGAEGFAQSVDESAGGFAPKERGSIAAALAELITNHREFPDAPWVLPGPTLDLLESVAIGLDPGCLAVPATEWFTFWPRPKGLDDDDPTRDQAIEDNRRALVTTTLEAGGLAAVVALAESSEASTEVGRVLAQVDVTHDHDIVGIVDAEGPKGAFARAYVNTRAETDGTAWVVNQLDLAPEVKHARLLVACPVTLELLGIVGSSTDAVRKSYWEQGPIGSIPESVAGEYVRGLLEYDRPWTAIDVIARLRRRIDSIDDATLLSALLMPTQGTTQPMSDWVRDLSHAVGWILNVLFERGVDIGVLACVEFYYVPFTHRSHIPRALYRAMETQPQVFVDMIVAGYRSDTEVEQASAESNSESSEDADVEVTPHEENQLGESGNQNHDDVRSHNEARAPEVDSPDGTVTSGRSATGQTTRPQRDLRRAEIAWTVLKRWPGLPAVDRDGVAVDADLDRWVDDCLSLLQAADRSRIATEVLGEALSSVATDPDGTWPSRPVRDIVERLADDNFDTGLHIGRYNRYALPVHGTPEGGQPASPKAQTYQAWADEVRTRWPRTAALLDEMVRAFERDVRRQERSRDR